MGRVAGSTNFLSDCRIAQCPSIDRKHSKSKLDHQIPYIKTKSSNLLIYLSNLKVWFFVMENHLYIWRNVEVIFLIFLLWKITFIIKKFRGQFVIFCYGNMVGQFLLPQWRTRAEGSSSRCGTSWPPCPRRWRAARRRLRSSCGTRTCRQDNPTQKIKNCLRLFLSYTCLFLPPIFFALLLRIPASVWSVSSSSPVKSEFFTWG